jgi:hypothetical protein
VEERWQRLQEKGRQEVFSAISAIQYENLTLFKFMHIRIDSAWGGRSSYALYRTMPVPDKPAVSVVVRRQFKQSHDYEVVVKQGVERDTPTILVDTARLDSTFETLWRLGTQLRLPLFEAMMMRGMDGADYELEFFGGMGGPSVCFRFWSEPPDEWKPLNEWMRQAIQQFDHALAAVSPP